MAQFVPAASRVAFVIEASERLQELQREMDALSPREENYASNRHALEAAIRELNKIISANVQ